MDIEQYFGDAMAYNQSSGENKSSQQEKWKSGSDKIGVPDDNSTGGFDCNICLDSVQDPVVTLCGHLYCWPCIYKWLHLQSISTESQDQEHQECPVCKAEVSRATLIPLYGRGQTEKSSKDKAPHLGMVIPRRPLAPGFGPNMPRTSSTTISLHSTQQLHHNYAHQSQPYYPQHGSSPVSSMHSSGGTRNMFDPMIGMFGEMVYARVFGNSITNLYTYPNSYHLAGSGSPRVRRHIMQADRSLSRICFFLFCCIMLCLLLF